MPGKGWWVILRLYSPLVAAQVFAFIQDTQPSCFGIASKSPLKRDSAFGAAYSASRATGLWSSYASSFITRTGKVRPSDVMTSSVSRPRSRATQRRCRTCHPAAHSRRRRSQLRAQAQEDPAEAGAVIGVRFKGGGVVSQQFDDTRQCFITIMERIPIFEILVFC